MFTPKSLTYVLAIVLLQSWVGAQDLSQAGTNPPDGSDQRMNIPMPLSADGPSLGFTSELQRSNFLNGGISIGSTFDDNVLNSSSNRLSNFAYSATPYIALNQTRARLNWTLNYMAGFTMNQRYSSLNQSSQDIGFSGAYRLAPHADLRVTDTFLRTSGFFDQVNQNPAIPTSGILDRPNQSLILPLSKQTANTSTAELDYQFSGNSMVGASGTFYFSHFRDTPVAFTLVDTQSVGAQAFYNYRLSTRNMIGLTYRFQRLSFSPIANSALVHTLLYVYTLTLKPNVSLSLFAGPQYTDTQAEIFPNPALGIAGNEVLAQRNWSGSGGGSFNWNGQRASVVAEFIREVTDGGGLLGVVRGNIADAGIRRQVSHSWGASLGIGYATNQSLITLANLQSHLRTATASIALDRSIGGHVGLRLGYARNYQQEYSGPAFGNINHNRAWASIGYNFSRPLGR
jgi:hypothetical protein